MYLCSIGITVSSLSVVLQLIVIRSGQSDDSGRVEGLIGCTFEGELCSEEELCVEDGLFGRCQLAPIDLHQYKPSIAQLTSLTGQLEWLVDQGSRWSDPLTQCSLLYYYLSLRFHWTWEHRFCDVSQPDQILLLLQVVEAELVSDGDRAPSGGNSPNQLQQRIKDMLSTRRGNNSRLPKTISSGAANSVSDGSPLDSDGEDDDDLGLISGGDLVLPISAMDRGEFPVAKRSGGSGYSESLIDPSGESIVGSFRHGDTPSFIRAIGTPFVLTAYGGYPRGNSAMLGRGSTGTIGANSDDVRLPEGIGLVLESDAGGQTLADLISRLRNHREDGVGGDDNLVEGNRYGPDESLAPVDEVLVEEPVLVLPDSPDILAEANDPKYYGVDDLDSKDGGLVSGIRAGTIGPANGPSGYKSRPIVVPNKDLDEYLTQLRLAIGKQVLPDLPYSIDTGEVEPEKEFLDERDIGKGEAEIPNINLPGAIIGPSAAGNDKILFKKDYEHLGILNQGTGNSPHRLGTRKPEHPVTQGPVSKPKASSKKPTAAPKKKQRLVTVDGKRINIKLDKRVTGDKFKSVEELMGYLQQKLHLPANSLKDVKFNKTDISFEVNPDISPEDKDRLGIIARNIRADVAASAQRSRDGGGDDEFVVPTLIVCGVVGGTLIVLLGLYVVQARSRTRQELKRLATDIESRPMKDYEELCRQHRISEKPEKPAPLSGGFVGAIAHRLGSQQSEPSPQSKTSSTSSWGEEPVQSSMDIGTGHMILSYMEDHLKNQDKIAEEWNSLTSYQPELSSSIEGQKIENEPKNRSQKILPYDHCRVLVNPNCNQESSDYINASFITDHDPRNPSYIACQGPLPGTTANMWQMIWEQGSVVIVNLSKLSEDGDVKCHRYWPENGSDVYHGFEVHLVSEHIWCEDYLVRSFYLKNLKTNETRTVTQFHYLTWPDHSIPSASKPLLEFRRKVNKSYRGRSCPIIVHCSDGAGRTGTYCLLDMVLNRINKGLKEIDIAATLEHLRDQRMGMVETKEQFEFVLAGVAEEVHAILKALATDQS